MYMSTGVSLLQCNAILYGHAIQCNAMQRSSDVDCLLFPSQHRTRSLITYADFLQQERLQSLDKCLPGGAAHAVAVDRVSSFACSHALFEKGAWITCGVFRNQGVRGRSLLLGFRWCFTQALCASYRPSMRLALCVVLSLM